jgi:hypothetical protein
MKEYFERVKKRAGIIILFGQMCIIMWSDYRLVFSLNRKQSG